ncbi:MAG: tetratricopeptide repeat protein [Bacteroidales bacterium]|nr:tetratricopeptide repeat protein [Bacteroidales bacterium]
MKFFFASLLLGASVSVFAQGFKDGIDFYSIGDYENARTILDRNINSAANKAEAFYYYGMIDFKEGRLDAAKANFDKGVAADAANPYNLVGQGAVLLKQGNKAGEDLFKAARKLVKKDAKLEVAIAEAYFAADPTAYDKKIEKCIADARKWTKDGIVETYICEGDMSMARNEVGNAMGKYEMAFTKDETNIEATVKYADTYFQVNKQLALQKLHEIIAAHPNSALVQRQLAEKLYENGDFAEAAERYGNYVKSTNNHFDKDEARFAQLLYFADKFDECYNVASALKAKITPASNYYVPACRMMMYSLENKGQWAEAAAIGKEMFAQKKGANDINFNFKDLVMYAKALEEAKMPEEAMKYYDEAIQSNPDNLDLARNLSAQAAKAKVFDKAIYYGKKVIDSDKCTANDFATMANTYKDKAASHEDAAAKAADLAEAVKYINKALEMKPNDIVLLYYKSGILMATEEKNNGAALETMQAMAKAIKALPADQQPAYNGTLGYAYQYIGFYYNGIKNKEKAVEAFKAWSEVADAATKEKLLNVIATLEK